MDASGEERRVRMLKTAVDLNLQVIAVQPGLTRDGALEFLIQVRELAARLFPDKREAFELIYTPRFERAIRERFGDGTTH